MAGRGPTEAREFVLKTARERNIKFVRLWFTDILGSLKSFAITSEELERALSEGMGFDGSSIEGFARVDESDMVAMPDPDTFQILPWRPKEPGVARMFCNIHWPGGKPFEGDPRYVLKRNLASAHQAGYTFYVGPELEYFYFKSNADVQPLDNGGYFDLTPPDLASNLRRDTILTLEHMGIAVRSSHHEAAYGQHEIDLQYTDALTMADAVMTHRVVVKQVAQEYGVYATFMPKPVARVNGSGMHVHMSLFRGDKNVFFDAEDSYYFSNIGKNFVAGLLRRATEITLITNQWVNSYKRLVAGYEAPIYVTWAHRNRSDLIRVPEFLPGNEQAIRVEYRCPDPACNPYLAFSVMLAAGLEGIERKYQPSEPLEKNVFEMSAAEREMKGIVALPGSLADAIETTRESQFVRKTLGDHIFHSLLQNKQMEWDDYRTQVTEYELKRYLPIL